MGNELRDFVIAAHGGLDRWNDFSFVRAHMLVGGALWKLKGQEGVLDDATVHVDLHRQFTSVFPFGGPGLRSAVTAGRAAVQTDAGAVIEERRDPRAAFAGHTLETPWDRLHLAYFSGYAMWTCLTAPFAFAAPGFLTEELEPREKDGRTLRRLKVTFPDHIATHCREQVFHIGADGLIRRHDYTAEVLGSTGPTTHCSVAHYSDAHREFDGIVVPTERRVHLIGEDGAVQKEPLLVSVDLDDVRFG